MNKIDTISLANYIIKKMYQKGKKVNHLKLQKLLFYVAVWHLVYTDYPIIDEDFQAWLHGPVLRSVWEHFKKYSIMLDDLPFPQDSELENINLTEEQEEIIDDVLDEYGEKSGYYLECLTHSEEPWKKARSLGENSIIKKSDMKKYYSELLDETC